MLCCAYPWDDAQPAHVDSGASSYPGKRRPVSTAPYGNPSVPHSAVGRPTLILVTVPPGVVSGQTIQVALDRDGSGRKIEAQVPPGMTVGSMFYIEPPADFFSKAPTSTVPRHLPAPQNSHSNPIIIEDSTAMEQSDKPAPFSQCLNDPAPVPSHSSYSPQQRSMLAALSPPPVRKASGKLLKVSVPPGTPAGTTIHVQVPGENRQVAAQVPPNCTQFHVEYDTETRASHQYSHPPIPPPVPATHRPVSVAPQQPPVANAAPPPFLPKGRDPPAQRELEVAIPPNVAPGTVIHVPVPAEPGRLLKVRVPEGDATASNTFRVSYVPQR